MSNDVFFFINLFIGKEREEEKKLTILI